MCMCQYILFWIAQENYILTFASQMCSATTQPSSFSRSPNPLKGLRSEAMVESEHLYGCTRMNAKSNKA
jgi:hypothetical protein